MSTQEHIQRIQNKLIQLIEKFNSLQKDNVRLKKDLEEATNELNNMKSKNDQLSLQLNMLKATESEDTKASKLALEKKINDYIKEIDKCIALLGNQS